MIRPSRFYSFAPWRDRGAGLFFGKRFSGAREFCQRGGEALACLALCALPFVLVVVVLAAIVRGQVWLAHNGDDGAPRRQAQRKSPRGFSGERQT